MGSYSSIGAWRSQNFELTATPSGTGTANVKICDNVIVVDVNGLASGETLTINTPFDFEIYDAWVVVKTAGGITASTVVINNDSTAVTNTFATVTAKTVARTTTLDDLQAKFNSGDDDLVVKRGAQAAGDFMVYIAIGPWMSTAA